MKWTFKNGTFLNFGLTFEDTCLSLFIPFEVGSLFIIIINMWSMMLSTDRSKFYVGRIIHKYFPIHEEISLWKKVNVSKCPYGQIRIPQLAFEKKNNPQWNAMDKILSLRICFKMNCGSMYATHKLYSHENRNVLDEKRKTEKRINVKT